jgi:hypothetical protein
MKLSKATLPILLISAILGGCNSSHWGHRVRGEGAFMDTNRDLATFDRISLAGGMKLDVVVGEPQSVVVFADANLHEYIRTRIEGSTLEIDFTESISTSNELRAKISVPQLAGLEISGSSELNVTHIDADDFYIEVAGSVSGVLEGTAKDLDVDIAGSGRLDLFQLRAEDVKIDIAGSGRLQVHAENSLDVDVAGSADVTYRGKPDLSIDQAGSASVRADKSQGESL